MPCDDCSRANECPPCVNEDRPVPLTTPCRHCPHPYNWHVGGGADKRCRATEIAVPCACPGFEPERSEEESITAALDAAEDANFADEAAKAAPPPCSHETWEVTYEEAHGEGKIFQFRRCQNCEKAWSAIIPDPDLEADTNEAPEGAYPPPQTTPRPPLAVVYRIAGEGFYEVLVPGDAVVSVQDGALVIGHHDRPVTGLMQVRPYGEAS